MSEITLTCPACGEPIAPERAFVVEVEDDHLVFCKDTEKMCPFVWSLRKLEEANIKLKRILAMFDKKP